MGKRVWLLGLVVIFVISLSGCFTARKNKDLEIQGLRNQVSALESQEPAKVEEAGSLDQSALSSELPEVKGQPDAKQIQTALKNAGYYSGTVDGKIGKKSRQAIRDFQKANNLSADGKVGEKTWTALKVYLEKKVK
ncbi:MAG: peptidoglycan-binding domain-containing protein [Candidatus Omnitrophica bacterium]|nr:peptidoglycan-binding domain-containing protein [Candidatus Omnitrophota bacterium]